MRLFVGLALDDATRGACIEAQQRLLRAAIDARYTDAENLHLTLAFLGEVSQERLCEIEGVIDAVAYATAEFELALDRIGAFPNERRPRIVYLGSRAANARFGALAQALREGYGELGFTFEDDAIAHVTLARINASSRRPLPMIEPTPHTMPVTHLTLFASSPAHGAVRYERRSTTALRERNR